MAIVILPGMFIGGSFGTKGAYDSRIIAHSGNSGGDSAIAGCSQVIRQGPDDTKAYCKNKADALHRIWSWAQDPLFLLWFYGGMWIVIGIAYCSSKENMALKRKLKPHLEKYFALLKDARENSGGR